MEYEKINDGNMIITNKHLYMLCESEVALNLLRECGMILWIWGAYLKMVMYVRFIALYLMFSLIIH